MAGVGVQPLYFELPILIGYFPFFVDRIFPFLCICTGKMKSVSPLASI